MKIKYKKRFRCILIDLAMIERTIKKHAPFILELPALADDETHGQHPFNDHLWQSFSNIETACDITCDEVETEWEGGLPTYEEYTKDMSLKKKLEMYYDADIDSPATSYKWTCADIADILEMGKDWLTDFELRFKEYLEEREYIRETPHGDLVNLVSKLMEIRKDWKIADFDDWEPFTVDKKNIDEWKAHMNETLFNDYDIDYLKEVIEQEENEYKDTSIDEQADTYIPHREGDE